MDWKFGLTFGLAWMVMFTSYCLRKPIGVLKVNLRKELDLSEFSLGLLGDLLDTGSILFQLLKQS